MKPEYLISYSGRMTPKREAQLREIAQRMTFRGTPTEVDLSVKRVRFLRLRWTWCKLRYRLIRRKRERHPVVR